MKNRIILVTGGARSGKSSFSEKLVCENSRKRAYLATCPVLDDEMRTRVERHQKDRADRQWHTIEEQIDLVGAMKRAEEYGADGVLVDCLTLWINNLLYHNSDFSEDSMIEACTELTAALKRYPGIVVLVLNEVGLGIVPDTPLSRKFRDCSGRCGQMLAAVADEVWFCICGIPQKMNYPVAKHAGDRESVNKVERPK